MRSKVLTEVVQLDVSFIAKQLAENSSTNEQRDKQIEIVCKIITARIFDNYQVFPKYFLKIFPKFFLRCFEKKESSEVFLSFSYGNSFILHLNQTTKIRRNNIKPKLDF